MPRKKFKSMKSLVDDLKNDIALSSTKTNIFIPDIITFCNSKKYLGLPLLSNPVLLYPAQQIMLKAFYRGSLGNENLTLTEEEIQLCKEWGLTSEDKGNVLDKYYNNTIFRELVLVWGRRSGKDFLSSIIALYEAMRLLECEGGDPYAIYNISSANAITILTIATARDQAGLAFKEMKEKLLYSPYFEDKFVKEGIDGSAVYLLTPKDKEDNKKFKAKKLPTKKGSIVLEVGHSNSDSLLGKGVFVLILDEVASYKQTGSSSSGERIYEALSPSLNTYVRSVYVKDKDNNFVLDEQGKQISKLVYDSKIISISSPRGQEGIFWKLFSNDSKVAERLSCRLPTWIVSPKYTEKSLREANSSFSDEAFSMEFGAKFSGTAGHNFFPKDSVDKCFSFNIKENQLGKPGIVYFAHLDPARTSHNYALVILHKETFLNKETKKTDFRLIIDFMKYWHPTPGNPLQLEKITQYVVELKRRYHFGLITYDQWNSHEAIQTLKKNGLVAKCTPYIPKYKVQIYDNLYNLIVGDKIIIPHNILLYNEMIHLQQKYTAQGYRVYPRREGEVVTDDLVDALAGAAYNTMAAVRQKLPTGKLVNMGNLHSASQQVWMSMQGVPLGTGAGGEVARRLEERRPWPMPLSNNKFV